MPLDNNPEVKQFLPLILGVPLDNTSIRGKDNVRVQCFELLSAARMIFAALLSYPDSVISFCHINPTKMFKFF